ncbi:MAG TPA: hypothetical protein VFN25_05575 [Dokdonella sp.]|uniref:hypothetical protein n=1 Tax=Dokdonella sp. TaxID=2291710 RepID=UPI002D80E6FF|nr:hypothetical protein [Dokdonella sp.]HET9032360.1 hypothetical protein [Dokdonella sp.]
MNNLFGKMQTLLLMLVMSLFLATAAQAGSIEDGRVVVKPVKENRYQVDGYTFGKAELFGYVSDLKETKKITGIVLKNGRSKSSKATDEQRDSVASIGSTLQLETFTDDGGDLEPLAKE